VNFICKKRAGSGVILAGSAFAKLEFQFGLDVNAH
jgi:hypothetical protein